MTLLCSILCRPGYWPQTSDLIFLSGLPFLKNRRRIALPQWHPHLPSAWSGCQERQPGLHCHSNLSLACVRIWGKRVWHILLCLVVTCASYFFHLRIVFDESQVFKCHGSHFNARRTPLWRVNIEKPEVSWQVFMGKCQTHFTWGDWTQNCN